MFDIQRSPSTFNNIWLLRMNFCLLLRTCMCQVMLLRDFSTIIDYRRRRTIVQQRPSNKYINNFAIENKYIVYWFCTWTNIKTASKCITCLILQKSNFLLDASFHIPSENKLKFQATHTPNVFELYSIFQRTLITLIARVFATSYRHFYFFANAYPRLI